MFKQLGTVYSLINDDFAYDILPIQSETNHERILVDSNNKRYEYNSQRNLHTLKKRNLKMENFCDLDILNDGNIYFFSLPDFLYCWF